MGQYIARLLGVDIGTLFAIYLQVREDHQVKMAGGFEVVTSSAWLNVRFHSFLSYLLYQYFIYSYFFYGMQYGGLWLFSYYLH